MAVTIRRYEEGLHRVFVDGQEVGLILFKEGTSKFSAFAGTLDNRGHNSFIGAYNTLIEAKDALVEISGVME